MRAPVMAAAIAAAAFSISPSFATPATPFTPALTASMEKEITANFTPSQRATFLTMSGQPDDALVPNGGVRRSPPNYRIGYRPGMAFYVSLRGKDPSGKLALVWHTTVLKSPDRVYGMKYLTSLNLLVCDRNTTIPLYSLSFNSKGELINKSLSPEYQEVKATEGAVDSDELRFACKEGIDVQLVEDPARDAAMLFGGSPIAPR